MKTRDKTKETILAVWYMCGTCSRSFTNVTKFVDHKTRDHTLFTIPKGSNNVDIDIKLDERVSSGVLKNKLGEIKRAKVKTSSGFLNNYSNSRSIKHKSALAKPRKDFRRKIRGSRRGPKPKKIPEFKRTNEVSADEDTTALNVDNENNENRVSTGNSENCISSQDQNQIIEDQRHHLESADSTELREPAKFSKSKTTQRKRKNHKVKHAPGEVIKQTTSTVEEGNIVIQKSQDETTDGIKYVGCADGRVQETAFIDSGVFDEGEGEIPLEPHTNEACENGTPETKKKELTKAKFKDASEQPGAEMSIKETLFSPDSLKQLPALKLYECPVCTMIVKNRTALSNHVQKRCNQCPNCAEKLLELNTFALKAHVTFYPQCLPLHCHTCDAVFSDCNEYMNHIQLHSRYPGYRCKFCPTFFQLDAEFLTHLSSHPSDNNFPTDNVPNIPQTCEPHSLAVILESVIPGVSEDQNKSVVNGGDATGVEESTGTVPGNISAFEDQHENKSDAETVEVQPSHASEYSIKENSDHLICVEQGSGSSQCKIPVEVEPSHISELSISENSDHLISVEQGSSQYNCPVEVEPSGISELNVNESRRISPEIPLETPTEVEVDSPSVEIIFVDSEAEDDVMIIQGALPEKQYFQNDQMNPNSLHVVEKTTIVASARKLHRSAKGGTKRKRVKHEAIEAVCEVSRTSISSKLIACPICSLSLLTKDLLLNHLTQGCKKCPMCKKRHSDLSDHLHNNAGSCLPIKCVPCNRLYFSYPDLRGHALTHAYDSKSFPLVGHQNNCYEP